MPVRTRRARLCRHLLAQEAASASQDWEEGPDGERWPEPQDETSSDVEAPLPLLPLDNDPEPVPPMPKRRKPKSSKPAPGPVETPRLDGPLPRVSPVQSLFRPRVLFPLALVVSLGASVPLLRRSLPDLSTRPEYQLRTSQIEVSDIPPGVPPDLVAQVIAQSGLPEEVSLLDDDVTRNVAEAFAAHPWVASVERVRISYPARLDVELVYRRPVAMIAVKEGMYPVAIDGTLLPPADFSTSDLTRYPVVTNILTLPQGPAGTPWGDSTVPAAARLAEVLAPRWKELHLVAIEAPRRTTAELDVESFRFDLLAEGGSRILWGRPPGTEHPGELSVLQKLGRLEQYVERYGTFDQPHGPFEIDIRHWQEISRRPLQSAAAPAAGRR